MVPDFIETKKILKDRLRKFLIERTSHHGVFPDNVRNIPLYECISYDQTRFDGSQETKKLEKLQGKIVLTKESLNDKGFIAPCSIFSIRYGNVATPPFSIWRCKYLCLERSFGSSFWATLSSA